MAADTLFLEKAPYIAQLNVAKKAIIGMFFPHIRLSDAKLSGYF
jgi:hypothetical protein